MKKHKVIFFVPFYPYIKGGAEYQAKIISMALQKKGCDIIYISMGHEKEEIVYDGAFKIYKLPVEKTLIEKGTLYSGFSKSTHQIISTEKPDFIYQRILNTFTYRLAKYAFQHSIPFLLHIADNYSIEFGKGARSLLKKQLFKRIVSYKPNIIAQTQYQYNALVNLGQSPIALVPNMHPPIKLNKVQKEMTSILWIGTVRPVKQLEIYLSLAKKLSSTPYIFHVIGKLPDSDYGKELKQLISETSNVKYHGEKDNIFINLFLQSCALLVNTSVSEGFSNTFIQAWMCGTPVVALNSDPDNTMAKFDIGIDCKGDSGKLPRALEKILEPKKYLSISKKSVSVANKLFSVEENVKKIEEIALKIT